MTITPSLSPSLGSRFIKELKELLYLVGPILAAQLASTGMGFIDTSMSGQYSARDLAAVALGTSIWIPAYLLVKGALMAVTPAVAQLFGAREMDKIASPVRQAMWMSLLLSTAVVVFMLNPEPLMEFLQLDPSMSGITAEYLVAVSWGIPAYCLYNVLTSYCEGRSITKPAMLISIVGLLINIPLNYVLIYGKFGFPELGGVGCGYATAICFTAMTLMMFAYVHFDDRHEAIGLFKTFELPNYEVIKGLLKLGVPMGLGIFFEASLFSAVALVIGKLGAIVVAGHQIALNFASMAFMVPLSLSIGITIRVGQAIGAGNMKAARFSSFAGIAATLITATISAIGMLLFAEEIASIYTSETAVLTLAAELLFFAAVFQYADGVQVAANGALRGYKDTKVPMVIIFIACWGIALPLGYTLGLTNLITEPMGPHGLWISLVAALTISAVFLTLRLRSLSDKVITTHQSTVAASLVS